MNLEKAKEEFFNYTVKYDLENDNMKRKQIHSLRVMEISKLIAKKIGLSQEEIELATVIGLLHDIGRFEQFTQHNTYKDLNSLDHGDLGANILQKDIRKYVEVEEYDEIIVKAVKNHNKYKIEEGLTKQEELFAKIVRDADKIDIFYESAEIFWKGKEYQVEQSIISENIIEQFENSSQVKNNIHETEIDDIVKIIAFIFDINFKASFEILKENDYINKILNRYKIKDKYTKQKVEEIRKIANVYIEQKTK